jgi:GntR family transcriptional regulator
MTTASSRLPGAAPFDRTPGVALHRQLYFVLADHIKRGEWPVGAALPTEEALCAQFKVSRITVRRALADLQTDGLVERRQGAGTFVRAGASMFAPQATLSFLDTLRRQAEETQVRVLEVSHAVPPAGVAQLLQIGAGEQALHAVRLRLMDGVPVMVTDAWVPERIGRSITAAALKKKALYELLTAQGVELGRVVQEISAEPADPAQARHLGMPVGAPLLKIVRLLHDRSEQPVQHLTARIPPDRGRVLMEVAGDQINTLSAGYISHHR